MRLHRPGASRLNQADPRMRDLLPARNAVGGAAGAAQDRILGRVLISTLANPELADRGWVAERVVR